MLSKSCGNWMVNRIPLSLKRGCSPLSPCTHPTPLINKCSEGPFCVQLCTRCNGHDDSKHEGKDPASADSGPIRADGETAFAAAQGGEAHGKEAGGAQLRHRAWPGLRGLRPGMWNPHFLGKQWVLNPKQAMEWADVLVHTELPGSDNRAPTTCRRLPGH